MWTLSGQGDDRYRWVLLAAFIPGLVAVCLLLFALKVVAAFLLWNFCEEPSADNHPPAN